MVIFLNSLIVNLILFVLTLIPILIAVAYIILAERKVMASIQRRRGPNVVGFFGLLQPFIDAVKLLTKEHIFPTKANQWIFALGPIFTLTIAILSWSFIPFNYTNFYYDYTYSVLLLLTFSSLGVYGIVLSGWASNSKYALLGSIRTIAQFISYELVLTISIFPIILVTHSLNFVEIVMYQASSVWFILPFWPFAYIFFIASLAETNRTPFDLPEAEAELVAGYNVEYSSVFFILFMFAEYSNIMLMSALFSLLFLGGWDGAFGLINYYIAGELIFAIKITSISFIFIVVRATQPRLRFDQLLTLCWKRLLPLVFALFIGSVFLHIFFAFVLPLISLVTIFLYVTEVLEISFILFVIIYYFVDVVWIFLFHVKSRWHD
jgi:NADH-quinone oxidoreductase subunit H